MTDMINHPPHYKVGGIETIDFIEAKDLDYHAGQIIRYISRYQYKGRPLEDLKKARWYVERLIENLESDASRSSSWVQIDENFEEGRLHRRIGCECQFRWLPKEEKWKRDEMMDCPIHGDR